MRTPATLVRYMREAVTAGTGRTLAANATAIAGKTGTAEVDDGRAHSWFAGFAPYRRSAPDRLRGHRGERRLRRAGRRTYRRRDRQRRARSRALEVGLEIGCDRTLRRRSASDLQSRLKKFFDTTLDAAATPLEIGQAVLDDVERRVEPVGRGRRVFPYTRLLAPRPAGARGSRAARSRPSRGSTCGYVSGWRRSAARRRAR